MVSCLGFFRINEYQKVIQKGNNFKTVYSIKIFRESKTQNQKIREGIIRIVDQKTIVLDTPGWIPDSIERRYAVVPVQKHASATHWRQTRAERPKANAKTAVRRGQRM